MCGIAGLIAKSSNDTSTILVKMTDTLSNRGPDDSGYETFYHNKSSIGMGHRRLSILDLSVRGHQPMTSCSKRYTIVYNGEVYNYKALRSELQASGHIHLGTSDTEVLLASFEEWGIISATQRFNGMFAFAVWDKTDNKLFLCRDRVGIKPLYYGFAGDNFLFGSQLKALKAHPKFQGELDTEALALYFRYNYIPAPYSIYKGYSKLEPGTILEVRCSDNTTPELCTHRYWNLGEIWQEGASADCDSETIQDELENLLKDSVVKRMVSDVPLGAFLSGGYDSSLVTALMQSQSSKPIRTFTIGFDNDIYNEAPHAKKIATHLGTDHTELYISPKDLLNIVPAIPTHWDEPFSDSSQIPTLLLARMTRESVTVALSGDGGDELFAGYTRYQQAARWWKAHKILTPVRHSTAHVLKKCFDIMDKRLHILSARKLNWRVELLKADNIYSYHQYLQSNYRHPEDIVKRASRTQSHLPLHKLAAGNVDNLSKMQQWDMLSYLPDDILTKIDRASMAVGLEARVPMLDHRIIALASRIPSSMKINGCHGKMILRNILHKHVPSTLVDRPKKGFSIPLDQWLGNELRDWAEDLLDENKIDNDGILQGKTVRDMWNECLRGKTHWSRYIWDIIMFQAWLRAQHAG